MSRRTTDLLQAKRLEVGLIGLRWFIVGVGVLQSVATLRVRPGAPDYIVPVGFVLVAALAIGNVVVSSLTERADRAERLRVIGILAFVLDIVVITGLVWTYTTPGNSMWVLAYLLPLEGAVRFQLVGALIPLAVSLVSEPLREAYLAASHEIIHTFQSVAVVFRVGIELVVAIVAGLMARSLRREADRARDRAHIAEEAARLAEEAAARLRELDEMKSDFVAITSHELRTPLAAIRGFVNTLQRRMSDLTPEETQEFLGIIDQQTERLARLVEDLLVVSRIEAGKLTFDPEPVSPSAFLENVVRGLGDGAGRVTLEVSAELPDAFVADPHRLGQVLTNLLENALKFSLSGSDVALSAAASDGRIAFEVRDRGVGIPAEELGRIFERFHQTDAASTRKAEGAGLGLYITKRLVEAMGGDIGVASEVGLGSTFTVRLPLRTAAPAPVRPSAAARVG
jgi:signal transduction histidine kinase